MGSWPSAFGTTRRSGWASTKRGLLAVARRRLWCPTRCWSKCGMTLFGFKGWASKETCWRCKANCSDTPWTDASTAEAWRTSRYRTSELLGAADRARDQCQTLCSHRLGFRPRSFASTCCIRWTWAQRRSRLAVCFPIYSPARVGYKLFSISCSCVCACVLVLVCVCACLSVLRVHVQLCSVSLAGPGHFRAHSRSGQVAELWNTIKLHNKTFHTQSRLQTLKGDDPRRPEASQVACQTSGDPPATWCFAASNWRWTSTSTIGQLIVRGLFEELFSLFMTMSVGSFDSAACARCSRQFCNLYKA